MRKSFRSGILRNIPDIRFIFRDPGKNIGLFVHDLVYQRKGRSGSFFRLLPAFVSVIRLIGTGVEDIEVVFKVMSQRLIADSSEVRFLLAAVLRRQFILILSFPDFSVHFFLLQSCCPPRSGGFVSQRQALNKL